MKVSKIKCQQKWGKLKVHEIEKIAATINSFVSYKPFESYRHPNPFTYLNQCRWDDELLETKNVIAPPKIIDENNYNNFTEYLKALKSAGQTERYEQEKQRLPAGYNL